jgi:hypothetical protein
MKKLILCSTVLLACLAFSCRSSKDIGYHDKFIAYEPVEINQNDKEILLNYINSMNPRYDSTAHMITKKLNGWNYHTDALTGTYHEVRSSFNYAVALLDSGEKEYEQRAFNVIDATIDLQDTDPNSRSCGVWPYYKEEPLATKKSPIDFNWADFNAVSLLDIYMYHKNQLPQNLLKKVENALMLAAKSVQKRDCQPDYTNIAIMGTYVTYMVSHLFNLPEMQEYASRRLKTFYDYTKDKGGFTEYNSPTYSIVALNELSRLKRNVVEPEASGMIDELYDLCWSVVAHHFHKPSAQWAGPHSRSYSTIVSTSFYGLLNKASEGKIDFGYKSEDSDVKIRHHIPDSLLHYFLTPEYPREEIDVFEKDAPQIVGTTYLTDKYAIGTASRSSLWNQRRPLTVYWGNMNNPHYLQVRFLHDFYDFSTASIYTSQKKNDVLAEINVAKDGGDRHINLDVMKDGRFSAHDLRIRFEFGNCKGAEFDFPKSLNDSFTVTEDDVRLQIQMLHAKWDDMTCHWEEGNDEANFIDCVIYNGPDKQFDLNNVENAAFSFILSVAGIDEEFRPGNAEVSENNGKLTTSWKGMTVEVPVKPENYKSHLPQNYPSHL